jgi:hypothetical protein
MKNALLFFVFSCLCACNTQQHVVSDSGNSTNEVIVKVLSIHNGVAKLYLKNNSNAPLMYEHWFGLRGNPVAYCVNASEEKTVCSKNIVALENGEYYMHEAVLKPMQSLTFVANVLGSSKVGIKYWAKQSNLQENYIWVSL